MRNPVLDIAKFLIALLIVALWAWKVVLPVLWPGFSQ